MGAARLWFTRKENGFFTVETTELVAFFRISGAPFRSECSLRPEGQLTTPLGYLSSPAP